MSINLCQYFKNMSTFQQTYVNISKTCQHFDKSAQKEGSARTRGRVFSRMPRPQGTWLYIDINFYILYASRNPAALLNSSRLHSCRCYCFMFFSIFLDIDFQQFYVICVTLGIIFEYFLTSIFSNFMLLL